MTSACTATSAWPAEVAPDLDASDIHLWWLPRRRDQAREPLLRVLAGYLKCPIDAIHLDVHPHGRPYLSGNHAGLLDFNWSHSGERAVIAIAQHLPQLGVDIEQVRPRRHVMALAERFYAANEYALLHALAEAQQTTAFVRLWTAKEALLKAHGRGLAFGPDKVELSIDHDRLVLARLDASLGPIRDWQLAHWPLAGPAFASLCWHGGPRKLRHFCWPGSGRAE